MNHTRDYYRKQRAKHISRKKRMIQEWSYNQEHPYWVAPAGALSKGKIHCSCPWCRSKSYDHKVAKDLARTEAMNQSESYYNSNELQQEEEDSNILNNSILWHWYDIEEDWYYEEDFYYDWLEDHPNSSTD